jgi:hypothetical protein
LRSTLSPKGARDAEFLISRCIQDCNGTNGEFDLLVGAILWFELRPEGISREWDDLETTVPLQGDESGTILTLLPSPPWGRGWTATGVLSSRGGTGEGVKDS